MKQLRDINRYHVWRVKKLENPGTTPGGKNGVTPIIREIGKPRHIINDDFQRHTKEIGVVGGQTLL